ncbi:MAG: HD-GYP domain-containing protein [Pirellula sp.]
MMTHTKHEIKTSDLVVGTTLPFALRDPEGNILHAAGVPVTERLLVRLESMGVSSVTVRGESSEIRVGEILCSYFDASHIEAITEKLEEGIESLNRSITSLINGDSIEPKLVTDCVESFIDQAAIDASAFLAVVLHRSLKSKSDIVRAISERSACMSCLSTSIATSMGLDKPTVLRTGLTALFSDISMGNHQDWFDERRYIRPQVIKTEEYRNHPLESGRMIESLGSFEEQLIKCVSQTHELADGSGFPNRLTSSQTSVESRIVSMSEVYLVLSSPLFSPSPFLESDSLAYMIHQMTCGHIDREVLPAMIKALSMFPIGSLVKLDDDKVAVVVQPNAKNPFQPIVKLCEMGGKVMDLNISNSQIIGPVCDSRSRRHRIEKAKLDTLLWVPSSSEN